MRRVTDDAQRSVTSVGSLSLLPYRRRRETTTDTNNRY